jgi:catechol 2,3-dioxygenase-like lactoylglutathione lyase family enzyme
MFTGVSHVSIVVPDLDAAARRLAEIYGLTIGAVNVLPRRG